MAETNIILKNPLESRLGYQLRRASVVIMADLAESLAELDLKPAQASILALIKANPAITQTEIGRMLAIQRANMVPLIASLMTRKLIARHATDGRSHALHLTSAGRALAAKADDRIQAHEDRFFRGLPVSERSRLLSRLRAIWE